ncbi:MAG: type II toxin-antitoxin system ParD family antitoxin [Alphaproteobacteria bacterium]
MAMMRKTITISEPMEAWIKSQIEAGRYANDSEYFRDLIRRDQERRAAEEELGRLIDEGEASGISDKTVEDIFREAEERYLARKGG